MGGCGCRKLVDGDHLSEKVISSKKVEGRGDGGQRREVNVVCGCLKCC